MVDRINRSDGNNLVAPKFPALGLHLRGLAVEVVITWLLAALGENFPEISAIGSISP